MPGVAATEWVNVRRLMSKSIAMERALRGLVEAIVEVR